MFFSKLDRLPFYRIKRFNRYFNENAYPICHLHRFHSPGNSLLPLILSSVGLRTNKTCTLSMKKRKSNLFPDDLLCHKLDRQG